MCVCVCVCFTGGVGWPISTQEALPYPDSLDKYKLFAQFLLQGKVSYDHSCIKLSQCVYRFSIYNIGDSCFKRIYVSPAGVTSCHGEELVEVSWFTCMQYVCACMHACNFAMHRILLLQTAHPV